MWQGKDVDADSTQIIVPGISIRTCNNNRMHCSDPRVRVMDVVIYAACCFTGMVFPADHCL